MENYELLDELGAGSFGTVRKAIDKRTCEVVAIKKLRENYNSWEECLNLREVKALRIMRHPNIVRLRELIRENCVLYFVFEYMDCTLYQFMKSNQKPFSEAEVRDLCFQVFLGLAHMHQRGYFHRDLKPDNLLIGKGTIKIADFGSAREITSQPPYTSYVTTRWYRAPEVMLRTDQAYTSKVDMWAMGAIMAELFTFRPLFPGVNLPDQMYKICRVIGSPTMGSWAEGLYIARDIRYKFPQVPGVNLAELIPSASSEAINLISSLCSWDPNERPTAVEALHHPFFQTPFFVPTTLRRPRVAVDTIHPTVAPRIKKVMAQAHGVSELVERMTNMDMGYCQPPITQRLRRPFP